MLAIALGHEVFRGNAVFISQGDCNALGATVGQAEVVNIRANGVGVALDEEDLIGVAFEDTLDRAGEAIEFTCLFRADFKRTRIRR